MPPWARPRGIVCVALSMAPLGVYLVQMDRLSLQRYSAGAWQEGGSDKSCRWFHDDEMMALGCPVPHEWVVLLTRGQYRECLVPAMSQQNESDPCSRSSSVNLGFDLQNFRE